MAGVSPSCARQNLGVVLGCAIHDNDGKYCHVVLAPDADIIAAGHNPEIVKRHEIAHCNGWPNDHPGARSIEEWATAPSIADVAAQFDKFALGAVGKTVAEVANSLPWTYSRLFPVAAARLGLTPESQITGLILSDPAMAMPLAKVVGISTDLPDHQWRQAHALAFQASKARQAENAAIAAQQAQPAPLRASNPKTV